MSEVGARVDGGAHLAAVWAEEAEVALAHLGGRPIATEQGHRDGHGQVAYAIVRGLFVVPKTTGNQDYSVALSGKRFVVNGRWPILGNYPDLLSDLPKDPEIYHTRPNKVMIEELAPSVVLKLRVEDPCDLFPEEEARNIGLLSGAYQIHYTAQELEGYLNRSLNEEGKGKQPRP